jgi:transcriptional activator SPT8
MTAQQKSTVGLGEGVNKAGISRGWWSVDVDGLSGGERKKEAVYSMACEGDGLWAVAGTQVSTTCSP